MLLATFQRSKRRGVSDEYSALAWWLPLGKEIVTDATLLLSRRKLSPAWFGLSSPALARDRDLPELRTPDVFSATCQSRAAVILS